MTNEERITIIARVSELFQEWLFYLQDAGTTFTLCPREDVDEAFCYWNGSFTTALEEELDKMEELTRVTTNKTQDNENNEK